MCGNWKNINYNIAGCVILYHPDDEVVFNIESYIDYLEVLYVIDNSNGKGVILELQKKYRDKIIPIVYCENRGIAYALNDVLHRSSSLYCFLMTMDQDSRFYFDSMARYVDAMRQFDWNRTLAIGPMIVDKNFNNAYKGEVKWEIAGRLITSGSIVSIQNAIKVEGFSEELFIDEVDFDFSYKGILKGYELYRNVEGIYLLHSIGETVYKSILGHKVKVMNHNPIRKYYIFRNRLIMIKKYYFFLGVRGVLSYIKKNIELILYTIFFEKEKYQKIKYIVFGGMDFCSLQTGKFARRSVSKDD